ncbi:MAG: 50S ribosomal protein L32 [bacterium]|nr:50S ribosomal protein L32 [bacterium]
MRHTRGHTNNRRSHHALAKPALVKEGSGISLRHRVNPTTGTYRGRKVLDLTSKLDKKAKRTKEKETSR